MQPKIARRICRRKFYVILERRENFSSILMSSSPAEAIRPSLALSSAAVEVASPPSSEGTNPALPAEAVASREEDNAESPQDPP